MVSELLLRPAVELAALVRGGQVSTRELLEAVPGRVEELNLVFIAFALADAARALAELVRVSLAIPARSPEFRPLALEDSAADQGGPAGARAVGGVPARRRGAGRRAVRAA